MRSSPWRGEPQSRPTRATHSDPAVADSIGAGQRLAAALINTPRPSVTHSLAERARKPLTCENVDEAVVEPAKSSQRIVIDAPRWHESGQSRRLLPAAAAPDLTNNERASYHRHRRSAGTWDKPVRVFTAVELNVNARAGGSGVTRCESAPLG